MQSIRCLVISTTAAHVFVSACNYKNMLPPEARTRGRRVGKHISTHTHPYPRTLLSLAFTSAPAATSAETIDAYPYKADQCRGLFPYYSRPCTGKEAMQMSRACNVVSGAGRGGGCNHSTQHFEDFSPPREEVGRNKAENRRQQAEAGERIQPSGFPHPSTSRPH